LDGRFSPVEQHEHPGPWLDLRGLSALRSLVSCAWRFVPDMTASRGAVISTRGAEHAQAGQALGWE
jgi:hypothetical protein